LKIWHQLTWLPIKGRHCGILPWKWRSSLWFWCYVNFDESTATVKEHNIRRSSCWEVTGQLPTI